ncbi:MAG: DUF87 domain-containing protein [Rhodobacterales bacterium]|nr:DUF87 domain-containing protein [Rhodobacterales bacterium]
MIERGDRIGAIRSVTGARAELALEAAADSTTGADSADRRPGIGDLLALPAGGRTVYALVQALREDADGTQLADLDFLGEVPAGGDGPFQRGLSRIPRLGDSVFAATPADVARVYARPAVPHLKVGTVHQGADLPFYVQTDDLLGKHMAVMGNTGSGKSCAVTLILKVMLDAHPAGHMVVLDPHDEYGAAFHHRAQVLRVDDLDIPYWLMTAEELGYVILPGRGAERDAQFNILREAILAARRAFTRDPKMSAVMTVDTPSPFSLTDLEKIVVEEAGRLETAEAGGAYTRLLARLDRIRRDRRFAFMFSSKLSYDNLEDVIGRILRIPVQGKPLTIIDLSGVPSEIVDVVVSMLCRVIFDVALWSPAGRNVPVLLVCEEAHRYIPADEIEAFGPTKEAISRIAREGRKHGVSLCLVSQRPSDLSARILSQCGTVFGLRLTNDRDQEFMRKALPEGAQGLISMLPALRTQEAVVLGEGVSVPSRILFDDLPPENRPGAAATPFSQAWQEDTADQGLVADIIQRWRFQKRPSE